MFKACRSGLIASLALVWIFSGCESEQVTLDQVGGNPEEWWNSPGLIADYMAAVGMSPLLNERALGPARTYAETDGRGKLAAMLKTRMNQLVENWSKDVGDLTRQASFSSYINNEAITRQFVDTTVSGAVPYKYHQDKSNVYVLMVLKDPSQWAGNLADSVRDQALQDETLFKTEVMKNDFRDRMDKLRTGEVEKVKQKQEEFQQKFGGTK